MLPADSRAAKDHITNKICAKRSEVLLIIIEIYSYIHKQEIATNDNHYTRKFRFDYGECLELKMSIDWRSSKISSISDW